MKNLQIYDNGGETLDRYTIFKAREKRVSVCKNGPIFMAIIASTGGRGVYMHIESLKGSFLGKRVTFDTLDEELQRKLINEFTK